MLYLWVFFSLDAFSSPSLSFGFTAMITVCLGIVLIKAILFVPLESWILSRNQESAQLLFLLLAIFTLSLFHLLLVRVEDYSSCITLSQILPFIPLVYFSFIISLLMVTSILTSVSLIWSSTCWILLLGLATVIFFHSIFFPICMDSLVVWIGSCLSWLNFASSDCFISMAIAWSIDLSSFLMRLEALFELDDLSGLVSLSARGEFLYFLIALKDLRMLWFELQSTS